MITQTQSRDRSWEGGSPPLMAQGAPSDELQVCHLAVIQIITDWKAPNHSLGLGMYPILEDPSCYDRNTRRTIPLPPPTVLQIVTEYIFGLLYTKST